MKQHDKLTDKLVKLTKTNTALMKELGDLTKAKMDIERELNHVPPVTTGDAELAELQDQKEMRRPINNLEYIFTDLFARRLSLRGDSFLPI